MRMNAPWKSIGQAEDSGDEELAKKLFAKIPFDVETLQSMKRLHGAEWLRENGINTSRADKKLGSGLA